MTNQQKTAVSGALAGAANGLFGGGGGMVLVPLLQRWCSVEEKKSYATCVAVIFPICLISAIIYWWRAGLDLLTALPYLIGGLAGGAVGGRLMGKISTVWLRRIFAAFLLYGGARYLL